MKIFCVLFLFTSLSSFALDCPQMSEPSKSLCLQNLKTQNMIANLSAQIAIAQNVEAPMTTICLANCHSQTSYAQVKEYFSNTNQGVSERLLIACKAHLSKEAQESAKISNVVCKPL